MRILSHGRHLTVKLSGRPLTPDWSRGLTMSLSARGDTSAPHGALERLLCGISGEVVKDVLRWHDFTRLDSRLECSLDRGLRWKAILFEALSRKNGKPPKIEAVDLAFRTEVEINLAGRQRYRAAVTVFEIAHASD